MARRRSSRSKSTGEPTRRCAGTRLDGKPCGRTPMAGKDRCWNCSATPEERAAIASKGGLAAAKQAALAKLVKGQFADVEVKLESPADMRRLLEALARGVLLGAVRPQQASAITGIVNSAAKIAEIETELALLAELERERSR